MVRRHANTDTRFSIDNQPLLPRAVRPQVQFESAIVLSTRPKGTWEKSRPARRRVRIRSVDVSERGSQLRLFEVTEVFTTVSPEQINAAMRARNGIASKQPVDFDDFLGMLRKERPSRVEQRKGGLNREGELTGRTESRTAGFYAAQWDGAPIKCSRAVLAIVDIVSAFQKVSTKLDLYRTRFLGHTFALRGMA